MTEPKYFTAVKGKTRWIGLAKTEPFTCENPNPIFEPGEIYFDFGETRDEAIENVKKSSRNNNE